MCSTPRSIIFGSARTDRVELGLLGALSFPEPSDLLWVSVGVSWLREVDRMVLVPVIEASELRVPDRVAWSEWPWLMLLVLEGPVLEPGLVEEVVVAPGVEPLPVPAELVLLGVGRAWRREMSSILVSRWDFRLVAGSFPNARMSSRILFLSM